MGHIHTEPGQHDLIANAYVIRTDFDQPKLMLHWHKKLNMWLSFGGHVELGENPWQAIAHELSEESGYELSQLEVLQPVKRLNSLSKVILHPQPINLNTHSITRTHFHIGIDFAFVTDQEPVGHIAEGESDNIRLFTRQELVEAPESELLENIRETGLYIFDECLSSWERAPTSEFSLSNPR